MWHEARQVPSWLIFDVRLRMLRYPYNVLLKTADGWFVTAVSFYGAFGLVTGFAFAKEGGRYVLVSGTDGRILGFLFLSAAVGYFSWIGWRANASWKAKITMRVSLVAFVGVLTTYLWRAFAS